MDCYVRWSEARTKIPPGKYHVVCIEGKKPSIWVEGSGGWGKLKNRVVLWFQVVEGEFAGAIIPMFLSLPDKGKRKLTDIRIPDGSRYYDCWRVANGGRRPRRARFKEMNPSKFLNKSYIAAIVDIKPKWRITGQDDPIEKPEWAHYSKVQVLYALVTGDPNR